MILHRRILLRKIRQRITRGANKTGNFGKRLLGVLVVEKSDCLCAGLWISIPPKDTNLRRGVASEGAQTVNSNKIGRRKHRKKEGLGIIADAAHRTPLVAEEQYTR